MIDSANDSDDSDDDVDIDVDDDENWLIDFFDSFFNDSFESNWSNWLIILKIVSKIKNFSDLKLTIDQCEFISIQNT